MLIFFSYIHNVLINSISPNKYLLNTTYTSKRALHFSPIFFFDNHNRTYKAHKNTLYNYLI